MQAHQSQVAENQRYMGNLKILKGKKYYVKKDISTNDG